MLRSLIPLAVAIVLLVGCKKKEESGGGGSDDGKVDSDPNATYTIKLREEQAGDQTDQWITETGSGEIVQDGKGGKELHERRVEFSEQITEVAASGGKSTKLTRTYKVAQKFDKKVGAAIPAPYEGKTVTVEQKKGIYEFSIDGKKMDLKDSLDLRSEFTRPDRSNLDALLPKSGVKLGEPWRLPATAARALGVKTPPFPTNASKSNLTAKLTRAYTKDGKQWGVITFIIELVVDPAGAKGKDTLKGSVKIECTLDAVIDGSARDSTQKLTYKMDVSGTEKGVPAKITADMSQEKTVRTTK